MKKATTKKSTPKKPAPEAKEEEQAPKPDERQAFRIMEAVEVGAENYLRPIYNRAEIAHIAARLLNGDVSKAVEQAIRLLAECDKQIREAEEANKISALALEMEQLKGMSSKEIEKLSTENKWRLGLPVQIGDLAKWITGQVRPDRARQSLRESFEKISEWRAQKRAAEENELGLDESESKPWTPEDRTFWEEFLKQHRKTIYDGKLRPEGADAILQQVQFFLVLKWRDENAKRLRDRD